MWAFLLLTLAFSATGMTEEDVTDTAIEERPVIAKGILKVSLTCEPMW